MCTSIINVHEHWTWMETGLFNFSGDAAMTIDDAMVWKWKTPNESGKIPIIWYRWLHLRIYQVHHWLNIVLFTVCIKIYPLLLMFGVGLLLWCQTISSTLDVDTRRHNKVVINIHLNMQHKCSHMIYVTWIIRIHYKLKIVSIRCTVISSWHSNTVLNTEFVRNTYI